jgi:hypothetical protein
MRCIRQVAQLAGAILFIVALLSSGTAEAGDCPPGYRAQAIFQDTGCYPDVGVDPVASPLITCKGRCEICAEYAADERRGCVQCGLSVACLSKAQRSGYKADAKQICMQNCRASCTQKHSDVEANLRKCRTSCGNECAH